MPPPERSRSISTNRSSSAYTGNPTRPTARRHGREAAGRVHPAPRRATGPHRASTGPHRALSSVHNAMCSSWPPAGRAPPPPRAGSHWGTRAPSAGESQAVQSESFRSGGTSGWLVARAGTAATNVSPVGPGRGAPGADALEAASWAAGRPQRSRPRRHAPTARQPPPRVPPFTGERCARSTRPRRSLESWKTGHYAGRNLDRLSGPGDPCGPCGAAP